MSVPVVAVYGALNALFNVTLSTRVSFVRLGDKVPIGTGGSRKLETAVRTHGNNAEYVPLALVILLLLELSGGSHLGLHALGSTLLVARVLHALGMPLKAPNPPRFMGTVLTSTVIAMSSVWILVLWARS